MPEFPIPPEAIRTARTGDAPESRSGASVRVDSEPRPPTEAQVRAVAKAILRVRFPNATWVSTPLKSRDKMMREAREAITAYIATVTGPSATSEGEPPALAASVSKEEPSEPRKDARITVGLSRIGAQGVRDIGDDDFDANAEASRSSWERASAWRGKVQPFLATSREALAAAKDLSPISLERARIREALRLLAEVQRELVVGIGTAERRLADMEASATKEEV